MKKYISCFLAMLFCLACSVTAFAETVVIAPENSLDADVKTSVVTQGSSFGMWFLVILAAVVVVFALIIFINKKRDNKNK